MLFDRFKANDKLYVKMEKAVKVFCRSCGEHVFYLKKESNRFSTDMLVSADPNLFPPGDTICPKCGRDFTAIMNGKVVIKTDKGYLP